MILPLCTFTAPCFSTIENDTVSETSKDEVGVSMCQSTEKREKCCRTDCYCAELGSEMKWQCTFYSHQLGLLRYLNTF